MTNKWIACSSGVYPSLDEDECEEEMLIIDHLHNMHIAYYREAEKCAGRVEPAHWWNEVYGWPLGEVIYWRHLPKPPPGMER